MTIEAEIFSAAWEIEKRYLGIKIEDSDRWDHLTAEADAFRKRYDGKSLSLSKHLMMAVLGDLKDNAT